MNFEKYRNKADTELSQLQGCLPNPGDLPNDKDELVAELRDAMNHLRTCANRLGNYISHIRNVNGMYDKKVR
jgi:hypothetical protein